MENKHKKKILKKLRKRLADEELACETVFEIIGEVFYRVTKKYPSLDELNQLFEVEPMELEPKACDYHFTCELVDGKISVRPYHKRVRCRAKKSVKLKGNEDEPISKCYYDFDYTKKIHD
ncbi:MAG: hypothetical protein S4CHLAM102_13750 [Chlamydiia bacterium]|nr:hypothetical protein [Chlamydiia bacterium]